MSERGPLEGVRVLDLSRVLAGPFCTMLLADLGAEVIKIEEPERGDDARSFPPFVGDQSAYFINVNRGKKSIALNLKHPKGREIFLKLAEISDVVVENFRPGVAERLGIGYEDVRRVNPKIVYASISGFGQYGPYRNRAGYDLIGQAMGGIMSITGWPDTPPTKVGTAIADILAALFCCTGILAALRAREITGEGQRVDVSLVDSVVAACEAYLEMYLVEGRVPTRIGNRYEFVYPYDSFRTKDGWVVIGAGNDSLWRRLCEAMGMEELVGDPRFETNRRRVENHGELKTIIEEWTRERSTREVVEILTEHGVPCAPVYTIRDVCEDEHVAAREMLVEIRQPGVGRIKVVGCPIKMEPSKARIRGGAPLLGQHTDEILEELLGYSNEEISRLREEGVVR